MVLGAAIPWEDADAVAVADVDGDGSQERFHVVGDVLHGPHGTHPLQGAWQKAVAFPLDGGSREELFFATGAGLRHRDAPIRVYQASEASPALLWERDGSRDQLTDLREVDGRLWLAAFEDTWKVSGGWLDREGFLEVSRARMAMVQLPLKDGRVVQGRLYGEQPKSDGSLVVHEANGEERTLSGRRGVRSIGAGDLDADGHVDLLIADGWHYAYGEHGLARLGLYRGPDFTDARTLTVLPRDYTINSIELVRVAGRPLLLLSGSHTVQILSQDDLGWRLTHVADIRQTDQAIFRRTSKGLSVLVPGEPAIERTVSLEPQ